MNEGRTTTGYFNSTTAAKQSCIEWQILDLADSPPMVVTIFLNFSRSSPRLIASMSAPISFVPNFSKDPRSFKAIAAFNAV